ncbi:MAG: hypothetical protein LBC35_04935 [Coriobacteriales bacterium]|jgi:alginate O-acetyltransferase complex protein AlgI|nr:hypothetical protein [Coriobacteriales bacterium]
MVFSSLVFVCIFLPVVFVAHSLIKNISVRNALLIIASLLFYSYGEPVLVVLMLLSTLLNYLFGRAIGAARGNGGAGAITQTEPGKKSKSSTAVKSDGEGLSTPTSAASTSAISPAGAFASTTSPGATLTAGFSPKLLLILAIIFNLGMLAVFKYANMAVGSLFDITNQLNQMGAGTDSLAGSVASGLALDPPLLGIVLPIGISFYTFQALSYVIDVYRGEVVAQKNYLNILLYISFFPQLIAGPIIKYHDIAAQLRKRHVDAGRAAAGLRRFCVGLAKKVLIANTVAVAVDALFTAPDASVNAAVAWLAALAYMLQIYYDFSGYSDMAIGMGKMFGFDFKENFNYPYRSTTIKEFWRRWHISLSTWFKEYLYIPLGGNRKGRARTSLNKIVVFFCTGLWHGASWTFVVWGLFHGLFLLLEDYLPIRKLPRLLGHLYTLLVVGVAFVLFRAADFGQAALFISQMFTGFWQTPAALSLVVSQLNPLFICAFVAGVVGAFGLPGVLRGLRLERTATPALLRAGSYLASLGLLFVCLLFLASGGYNPFIYFRF